MQYKIYFTIHVEPLVLTEAQFDKLVFNLGDYFVLIDDKIKAIDLSKIAYIIQDDEAKASITTPPTPQDLKNEEERNKAAEDITLDAQLAKL